MKMFSKEFLDLLTQVIKSWQVIAVAIVFILYVKIVSYVGRGYHVPKRKRVRPAKKEKAEPAAPAAGSEESGGGGSNDELGLEEA
jgi:hypothetical protein